MTDKQFEAIREELGGVPEMAVAAVSRGLISADEVAEGTENALRGIPNHPSQAWLIELQQRRG